MDKDYYNILGIKKDASQEEIVKAYRKKAMMFHPDRQIGKSESEKKDAEDMFKQCSEAYETLQDPEKRKRYDMFGPEGANQQGGGFGTNFDPREFFRRHMHGFGFGDFDGFPGFGFGGGMDSQGPDPDAPEDGRTVRLRVSLPLEDMIYGTKKTFDIKLEDICDHCHGTGSEDGNNAKCQHCGGSGMMTQRRGMMIMQSTCPHCHGTGRIITNPCHICHGNGVAETSRHLEVDIPRGIGNGENVSVCGVGLHGRNGGKTGDVIITVSQEKHGLFERDGMDLLVRKTVPVMTALLGGKTEIMTPWGKTELEIPQGTNSGKVLRVKGHGVRRGSSSGDLYVEISLETMTNLTEEQKKVLGTMERLVTKKNCPKTEECKAREVEFEKRTRNRR